MFEESRVQEIVIPQAVFGFIQVFAERMGLETGWNCHISLREGGHLLEDRGSSATVSDRNTESLYDIQDDVTITGQDGDEKHVSWWGLQSDSVEKGKIRVKGLGCAKLYGQTELLLKAQK